MKIPTPEDVFKNDAATLFSEMVIAEISASLKDPDYVRKWRYGTQSDPYFDFVFQGTATYGDKEAIRNAFLGAGWGTVVVTNSSENNERPGLAGVKIYKNSKESINEKTEVN